MNEKLPTSNLLDLSMLNSFSGFSLRNLKGVFKVNQVSKPLLKKMNKMRYNRILKLERKITLTIYPNSSNSFKTIHVTGIKCQQDFKDVKKFLQAYQNLLSFEINNTFFILKPILIENFLKFVHFCSVTSIKIEFNLNIDNIGDYPGLNVIYMRSHSNKEKSCVAMIHRKSISILGAKTPKMFWDVVTLVKCLFTRYLIHIQKN